jgi:aryl-alcohol dehydrogenase-like predicted oxidoreductase
MNRRALGRTGLQVSEIGYGAWGIGGSMWLGAEDEESLRALHRAADLGLNFIDTALAYGDGHSEELVGKMARERDERIVVAKKEHGCAGGWRDWRGHGRARRRRCWWRWPPQAASRSRPEAVATTR